MEIQAGRNTPYVNLDKGKCILTIKGKSYPEYTTNFYEPIWEELVKCSDYMESSVITFDLGLEIMNSTTEKYIYKIMKKISESSKKLIINWHYEEDDEDMKEDGKMFKELFPYVDFNIIRVDDINKV